MPGICGIISRLPAANCVRTVQTMTATMCHEAFHRSGEFAASDLGVYAGWVAHENSFADNQVFENETKDVALVFCGEVFAPAETKAQLRREGHQFSETGGEWLVHLYEARGEKFFAELNGLFSGLLIDRRQKKVFLFTDRFGMERVYWHETPEVFYFATEAKALLRVLPETREFDADGVAHLFGVGCTMAWRSLFRGVQILPGGSVWRFTGGTCHREKYFSPSEWEQLSPLPAAEFESRFAETLKKILPGYFTGHMPVGVALTGGLDTRMIMACLPKEVQAVCYTFTGKGRRTLDDSISQKVAAACGLRHELLPLREDFFSDFGGHADRSIYLSDGVFGIAGTHELYFHRQARGLSDVRLTGNYGGEVFRGISTFKPQRLASQMFDPGFAPAVTVAAGQLSVYRAHPTTFSIFREVPWMIFCAAPPGRSQITMRTPYLDNELVKLAYQLPEELKNSSHPSARLVKANDRLLSGIATDRGFAAKNSGPAFLARRFWSEFTFKLDYYNNEGLPRKLAAFNPMFREFMRTTNLAGLHKYLHYSQWFRRELNAFATERLAVARARHEKFFDPKFLGSIAARHASGRENFMPEINAILTLEAIERLLLRQH